MTATSRYLGLLLSLAFSSVAAEPLVQIAPAGSQSALTGPAQNFTGQARVDPLFVADSDINASAAYVTFEPGARSAWHTHLAVTGVVDGKSVTWMEKVTDEHYRAD